jgi:hypothetical protein
MKKYTHAWLAFMAIKRLEDTSISEENRKYANSLINWFKSHKDCVVQGAWYPDEVIKDMATSHVLKLTPLSDSDVKFKILPNTYMNYQYGKTSPVRSMSFTIEKGDNLPDRCDAIAHSVVDHLKLQEHEEKGSPVSPSDNQIALLLFMLSHYVADAHMPLHCDSRQFSEGINLHDHIEGEWEKMIKLCYQIDENNERFFYDPVGYPLKEPSKEQEYQSSPLKKVSELLDNREFLISWGGDNQNVWDFMSAICEHSYLLSYCFIPEQYTHTNVTLANWQSLSPTSPPLSFEDYSVAVLSDAIDSIARIWLRVWRRYMIWEKEQRSKAKTN